jgi:hypothetical protein
VSARVGAASLRFWFDSAPPVLAHPPFDPRRLARAKLAELPELPGWSGAVPKDLRDGPIIRGPNSVSVRFHQVVGEYRVRPAEVVVNLSNNGRVGSVFRHYHAKIPPSVSSGAVEVREQDLGALLGGWLGDCESWGFTAVPELIVYHQGGGHRGRTPPIPTRLRESKAPVDRRLVELLEGVQPSRKDAPRKEYRLVWDLRVAAERPARRWRLLVDAQTGALVQVEDLRFYATGSGRIFDPNPAVTSGNAALTWNDTAAVASQAVTVTLDRLKPKRNGTYRLDGTHVLTEELSAPPVTEPVSAVAQFGFGPKTGGFLSVMTYFHIDRFRAYLQDALELTDIPVRAVKVDANVDGDETWAGDTEIRFGAGSGAGPGAAPDATDALVIIHEYGHVLQAMIQSESVRGNWPAGITEGFGDFLAAVYFDGRHQPGAGTRGFLFPWSRPAAQLRNYRVDWLFGSTPWQIGGPYEKGQLWCTTMFEVYRKLGGDSRQGEVRDGARDLAIRLFTAALTKLPEDPPVAASETVLAAAIAQADAEMDGWWWANGLHRKVLRDTFGRRDIIGYRPADPPNQVDVYIADGRAGGGYGSDDGQDLFDQTLWKDDHGTGLGKDFWATRTPYRSNAARAAADPVGDHVEPAVGALAHLYVRVRNRGVLASGPLTVRVFIAVGPAATGTDPELLWPDAWLPGELAPLSVPNVAPGGPGVVVGPFTWTPAVAGIQPALAVVECPVDLALIETLTAPDHVPAFAIVPFDNNIVLRRFEVG